MSAAPGVDAPADVWGGFAPAQVRDRAARRLRVMGHPVRLQMLERLSRRPVGTTVEQLAGALGLPPKVASSHLRALAREGLVARRQHAQHARYTLADRDYALIGAVSYRATVSELLAIAAAIREGAASSAARDEDRVRHAPSPVERNRSR